MQVIKDDNVLDSVLNSVDVRREVREAIGLTLPQFNILISKMKKGGVIINNKIDKHYIPNIQLGTNQYRLTLIFDINDEPNVKDNICEKRDNGDGEDGI